MAALAETKFMHLSETAQTAWLWRVARNKVADAFRKAAFRRQNRQGVNQHKRRVA